MANKNPEFEKKEDLLRSYKRKKISGKFYRSNSSFICCTKISNTLGTFFATMALSKVRAQSHHNYHFVT